MASAWPLTVALHMAEATPDQGTEKGTRLRGPRSCQDRIHVTNLEHAKPHQTGMYDVRGIMTDGWLGSPVDPGQAEEP